jgi:hypothetical protein
MSADDFIGESAARHAIFSIQKEIDEVYEFETELYYKSYQNIYQFNQTVFANLTPSEYRNGIPYYSSSKNLFNDGSGKSFGIEILLKKDVGAFTGWLGYSLSRTEYIFDAINSGNEFIPRHDRTSVVNAVFNFDWNNFKSEFFGAVHETSSKNWFVTLNFVYASGQPITTPASAYFVNVLPHWNTWGGQGEASTAYTLYPSQINRYRLPPYIRLDASVNYKIRYDGWTLTPYLQVFNIGNRKNVWFISYKNEISSSAIRQVAEKVGMLPLLPSIGVNVEF